MTWMDWEKIWDVFKWWLIGLVGWFFEISLLSSIVFDVSDVGGVLDFFGFGIVFSLLLSCGLAYGVWLTLD